MRTAPDKFKDLLHDDISPWLKEQGFKRRDVTFRRRRPGAWQIVNFQRDARGDYRFTVNLGVALDVLNEGPEWSKRGWPLEYECDFRERLAMLVKGKDHWWRLRPTLPLGRVSKDVRRMLADTGLPWLDEHADPKRCLEASLRDSDRIFVLNLPALERLAETIGNDTDVAAARAAHERRRQRNMRRETLSR